MEGFIALKDKGNRKYAEARQFEGHTAGRNALLDAGKYWAQALELLMIEAEAAEGEGADESDIRPTTLREADLVSIYLNLSLVGLKLDSFDTALKSADAVLAIRPLDVKATFRRGEALLGLGNVVEVCFCGTYFSLYNMTEYSTNLMLCTYIFSGASVHGSGRRALSRVERGGATQNSRDRRASKERARGERARAADCGGPRAPSSSERNEHNVDIDGCCGAEAAAAANAAHRSRRCSANAVDADEDGRCTAHLCSARLCRRGTSDRVAARKDGVHHHAASPRRAGILFQKYDDWFIHFIYV